MYKNIGQELKDRAENRVAVCVLKYGILGLIAGIIVGMFSDGYFGLVAVFGLIFGIFIGYGIGREKALMLYSYAEMVDCAVKIQVLLKEKEIQAELNKQYCNACGKANSADAHFCAHCGMPLKVD